MKRRSESCFGLHFDFHASPENAPLPLGTNLREEDIRKICQLLKPDFLQIDCKGHPGWASYPSECGNAMPEFAQDTLELWRRVTKEEDVALYMHYSGVVDRRYCDEHPDQFCRDTEGNQVGGHEGGSTRTIGTYADDVLIPQLCEVAGKYGVDGAWVDGECWGTVADFHPETVAAFEKETGICLNGKLPGERGDEYFEEYRDFCRELFRRYLRHYVDSVHEKYPDFQIASNWAFTDHMPEPVCADVDFISGDLDPYNGFNSARYAGRAIAQQGHTWDLMSWNFRGGTPKYPGHVTKHPIQIIQEAAAVISLGGGFQNYITQFRDGAPRMQEICAMKAVADFIRQREKYCFRGKAKHQVAILLSAWDRKHESGSLFSRTGYERVLGTTALLCDAGHSTEIVSEHTIKGKCADYPVLIIPELYKGLSAETMKELLEYAQNGGNLILMGKKTCEVFAAAGAPFAYSVPEDAYRLFTMDKAAFGYSVDTCGIQAEDGEVCAVSTDGKYEDELAFAAIMPFGKGKIAAIGADIGLMYMKRAQYLHKDLMCNMLDKMYTPIASLENAEGKVEITVLEKDGRMMVQLVNANGNHADPRSATEDFIPACYNVQLALNLSAKPQKLILQPEGKELDFTYENGKASVTLDKLNMHEIIEVIE